MSDASQPSHGLIDFAARAAIGLHRKYNTHVLGCPDRYERLYRIFAQERPQRFMEIGVWRGERASKFIELALKHYPANEIEYFGFDLFEMLSNKLQVEEVSKSATQISMVKDRLARFEDLGVKVRLIQGDTKITLPREMGSLPSLDFIFIDGGHSYESVSSDWQCASQIASKRACIVFDDIVNKRAMKNDSWGVNQCVDEIDRSSYSVEFPYPVDWWAKDYGILRNRLAVVRRLNRNAEA